MLNCMPSIMGGPATQVCRSVWRLTDLLASVSPQDVPNNSAEVRQCIDGPRFQIAAETGRIFVQCTHLLPKAAAPDRESAVVCLPSPRVGIATEGPVKQAPADWADRPATGLWCVVGAFQNQPFLIPYRPSAHPLKPQSPFWGGKDWGAIVAQVCVSGAVQILWRGLWLTVLPNTLALVHTHVCTLLFLGAHTAVSRFCVVCSYRCHQHTALFFGALVCPHRSPLAQVLPQACHFHSPQPLCCPK